MKPMEQKWPNILLQKCKCKLKTKLNFGFNILLFKYFKLVYDTDLAFPNKTSILTNLAPSFSGFDYFSEFGCQSLAELKGLRREGRVSG